MNKKECKIHTSNPEDPEMPIVEIMIANGESSAITGEAKRKSLIDFELAPNCFSDSLNLKLKKIFPCCYGNENTKLNIIWMKIRRGAYDLAENKNFELFIIFMIVLSSIALVLTFFLKIFKYLKFNKKN